MAKQNYRQNYYKVPISKTGYIFIIFLMIGIVLGFILSSLLVKDDKFELIGDEYISLDLVDTDLNYQYKEEGVVAISFSKDVSSKVQIETNLELIDGYYQIPLNVAGTYQIKYTVDCFKYGDNFISDKRVLIRKFVVEADDE